MVQYENMCRTTDTKQKWNNENNETMRTMKQWEQWNDQKQWEQWNIQKPKWCEAYWYTIAVGCGKLNDAKHIDIQLLSDVRDID